MCGSVKKREKEKMKKELEKYFENKKIKGKIDIWDNERRQERKIVEKIFRSKLTINYVNFEFGEKSE
jgi:hypothetical protein